jgi:hypothetical protein
LLLSAVRILQGTSITSVCDELEAHITRSGDYLKAGHVRNAVAILEAITPPIAAWSAENGPIEEYDAEDKQCIEGFYALLENAWQAVIDQCKVVESPAGSKPAGVAGKTTLTRTSGADKQAAQRLAGGVRLAIGELAKHELEYHSTMMAAAKKNLTPSVGPMFSDPLRLLNKKRAAAVSTAAAASPAAATPAAGAAAASSPSSVPVEKKRKQPTADTEEADNASESKMSDEAAAPVTATSTASETEQPAKKLKA